MTDPKQYRSHQLKNLTDEIGVYALCDLDEVPIYIGQSVDGIRTRVRRHLTSARSDIIANRQIDVWEIGYVWAWPVTDASLISPLEAFLFWKFDRQKPLMNGTIPAEFNDLGFPVPNKQTLQIITEDEISDRRDPTRRLPRQISQYLSLVDYILNVKDGDHLKRSLDAHFDRLIEYHRHFLD